MTTPRPPRPAPPDPQFVADLIEQFKTMSDVAFAESLADTIMDPDNADAPAEIAAFRSVELAQRSLDATRYLLGRVNAEIRQRPDESRGSWGRRAVAYREKVGFERRRLEAIITGRRAERGILSAAPNPRARAREELQRRHPQEYLEILREEQEAAAERARVEKAERKAARSAARKDQRR